MLTSANSSISIVGRLNQVEVSTPATGLKLGGVSAWPLVRFAVGGWLQNFSEAPPAPPRNRFQVLRDWTLQEMRRTYGYRIMDRTHQARLHPADVALFVYTSQRRVRMNGGFLSYQCDPVRFACEEMGLSTFMFEVSRGVDRFPRLTTSMEVSRELDLVGKGVPPPSGIQDATAKMVQWLAKGGIETPRGMVAMALAQIGTIEAQSRWLESALCVVKPKLVFVVCYYDGYCRPLLLACSRLGIPVVDLQHGVQGREHRSYGPWLNLPREGYEWVPNRFWCWRREDMEMIRAWTEPGRKRHDAVWGGDAFLERLASGDSRYASLASEARRVACSLVEPRVLVTLQPVTGLSVPIRRVIEECPEASFLVRMHPTMKGAASIRAGLVRFGPRVVLDEGGSVPVPALAAQCEAHVTHFSSTAIEADALGVATLFVDERGPAMFPDLVAGGRAMVGASGEALRRVLALRRRGEQKELRFDRQLGITLAEAGL